MRNPLKLLMILVLILVVILIVIEVFIPKKVVLDGQTGKLGYFVKPAPDAEPEAKTSTESNK